MWKWKKIGWGFAGAFVGLFCFAVWAFFFGMSPVFRASRITEITHIGFPKNATVVSGVYYYAVPSEKVVAQIQIPPADVSAFLSQPKMSPADPKIHPAFVAEFQKVGWHVADTKHLQSAWFSNGGFTQVWVDHDDPQTATVYLYYDEP